jgi:glycosyltransferase involved in cell wall biosynthesis
VGSTAESARGLLPGKRVQMKIAQIAPPWLPIPPKTYGGTERVIADLVEEQVAQGHDVTLFAPGDAHTSARLVSFFPTSLREQGVPWSAHLRAYYHLEQAVEAVKAHDVDIVHTHLSSSADLYLFPLTASLGRPHVTTLHSRFPFDRVNQWTGDADDFYLKQWAPSVPIVTISEHARAEAPSQLRMVGVVHNGLSLQQFVPTGEPRDEYLVWLGGFTPEKGPHLACEAARRAGRPLVLAGTIDCAMQKSMSYFHEVIEPQIDQQQVRYIGPVTQKQKIDLLSRAYGFLNPIQWEEPFGMVMIEAMALGCPVISFARGAAPELIMHGETGFLAHTIEEMVQFILQLAQVDREFTRTHVKCNFSARTMANNYAKVYQHLLSTAMERAISSSHS